MERGREGDHPPTPSKASWKLRSAGIYRSKRDAGVLAVAVALSFLVLSVAGVAAAVQFVSYHVGKDGGC